MTDSPQGRRPRIVVLGSTNMDVIATTQHLPEPGETVLGLTFTTAPGGKGANQAIAAAKAGGDVHFIGAVGTDDFGTALHSALRENSVRDELLRLDPGRSGVAVITVDEAGENSIVVVQGANARLTGLTPADRQAIEQADILVCQLEVPLQTVTAAAVTAAAAGVPVLLNPSPVAELPPDLLTAITLLVVNRGEAARIGGAALAAVAHVVTTTGPTGAQYQGPGVRFEVLAPRVRAVDTTGAGDAFAGALAVAWATGLPPLQAVRMACAAGALATTAAGASPSSPRSADIAALVAATYH